MRRRKLDANVQLNLRVKEKLRRRLEAEAKAHQNSINEEVRHLIDEALENRDKQARENIVSDIERRLESNIERFDNLTLRMTEQIENLERKTKSPPKEEGDNT
jgi:hypothetical protein